MTKFYILHSLIKGLSIPKSQATFLSQSIPVLPWKSRRFLTQEIFSREHNLNLLSESLGTSNILTPQFPWIQILTDRRLMTGDGWQVCMSNRCRAGENKGMPRPLHRQCSKRGRQSRASAGYGHGRITCYLWCILIV